MQYIPAKTIVTRTKNSYWFGTQYNMNIYRGCCHGCIYCDSRSTCYRNDNFDEVRAKENALQIIAADLRRKVRSGVIGTGAMSDPYNPFEQKLELTRHALELISAYRFGVSIATKSPLIVRDADVLTEIAQHSPVICQLTITCADDDLSRKVEPNVPASSKRFEAIRRLSSQGIFAGVLLMPVLPFIQDNEQNILGIVRAAAESGARFIYPGFGMTMREGQREYFYDRLDESFPGMSERYRRKYGERYNCTVSNAKALYELFEAECSRLGLLYKMGDIVSSYKMGYECGQLSFFDL